MDCDLHRAIKLGQLEDVIGLFKNGISVNKTFGTRGTPLCAAIYEGKPDILQFLLSVGCDVNASDFDGEPPLCLAIGKKHYDLAKTLINFSSCDKNKIDPLSGKRPLHIAVSQGSLELVKCLVENKCEINATDGNGNSALHEGIKHKQNEICKYLIDKGIDCYISDYDGNVAIHFCVINKNTTLLQYLIENKTAGYIDVSTKALRETPLMIALRLEDTNILDILIENGCDVNIYNDKGECALSMAVGLNMPLIVKKLLQSGASLQFTAEKALVFLAVKTSTQLLQILVEYGANVNEQNSLGWTPLYMALSHQKKDAAKFILENCSPSLDISLTTIKSENLLFALEWESDASYFAERLITLGCDVNHQCTNGQTPLHIVQDWRYAEVLLKNGSDPDICDNSGYTALHLFALEDQCDIIATLIQWGASVNISVDNVTPLHSACLSGLDDMAMLLLACGCHVAPSIMEDQDDFDTEICTQLTDRMSKPLDLKRLCRFSIINMLKCRKCIQLCAMLPLPVYLIDFIRFKELDVYKNE